MSYHISNLGSAGRHARAYADIDGYVPQVGDDWRDMRYDLGPDDPDTEGISDQERSDRIRYLDEEWWPDHVQAAVEATEAANAANEEWQQENV